MSLLTGLKNYIKEHRLFGEKDNILFAVSGGMDSVVLCELLHLAGYKFSIAHCNFQLRGEESERDAVFVMRLADHYGATFFQKVFATEAYAAEHKMSIQVAARELRYQWFAELIRQEFAGNALLLTAHHLDDNIETSLMNYFKGTGIAGLRGMLPANGSIIRPLLFAHRAELLQFANTNQIKWVEDSSNASTKYARNFLRHEILPRVKELYPEAANNIANSLNRFRDIEALYQESIARHKKSLLVLKGEEIHIPILKLKKAVAVSTIIFEITREFGFSAAQVGEIINLLDSEAGKYVQSSSHRIIKNRNWLIIAPLEIVNPGLLVIEQEGSLTLGNGTLELSRRSATNTGLDLGNQVAILDASIIRFPLLARKWKTGDYFYPLGMKKKKKIARFLIDQKLSKTDKEKVYVIEMDKKIIWLLGHRIDDRFKVTDATRELMILRWQP